MREIKFKAYVPNPNGGYMIIMHPERSVFGLNLFRDKYISCIIVQYTGLKDKNGVEIYERDIVLIAGNFSGQVFDRLGCWFVEMGKELGYYPNQDIEIIGNIYENPELLKDGEEVNGFSGGKVENNT